MTVIFEQRLLTKVKINPRYKKLIQLVRTGLFSLDTEAYLEELDRMHGSRKIRIMSISQVLAKDQHDLIEASLQNQAYRSRCVEIKSICIQRQNKLADHIDILKKMLTVEYKDILQQDYRLQADKNAALDTALRIPIRRLKDFNLLCSVCDLIIEDLDKASWYFRGLIDTLKLSSTREMNI